MFQDQQLPRIPGFVGVLRRYLGEIRDFSRIETGAVTVDWVVLTAATVGLGLASVAAVRSGVGDLGGDIEGSLSGAEVAALSFAESPPFTYGFFWFSQGAFETRLAQYDNWNDAQLLSNIATYSDLFSAAADLNSPYMIYADEYFVMQTLATQRGLALPPETLSMEQVSNLLIEAGRTPACHSYGCATAP